MSDLSQAERFLHEKIPLTRAMGVRVISDARAGFAVEAPVALNHNHLHTAFGGSINAVATLAGYTFLWLRLGDEKWHVVVRESSIRFIRPVRELIRATCLPPRADALREFDAAVARDRKARLRINVQVSEAGDVAAEFDGTFVAIAAGAAAG